MNFLRLSLADDIWVLPVRFTKTLSRHATTRNTCLKLDQNQTNFRDPNMHFDIL
jgi:hypothetical protein